MLKKFYRDTWAEIDLQAIAENVRAVSRLYKGKRVLAVVKANGYGHGAIEVAKTALKSGATHLTVAMLDEAIELRRAGITAPILVFSRTRPEDVETVIKYDVIVTVFQLEWLIEAKKHIGENECVHIHVKLDTGMGRVGVREKEEAAALFQFIKSEKSFALDGIYTHYATADERDQTYMNEQHNRFVEMLGWLREWKVEVPLIHNGNSAFGLRFPTKVYDAFRLGVSMYGLTPSPEITEELQVPIKPAFSLKSRLIQVKKLYPGDSIGYGATYQVQQEEWIGTIPIGYADGWLRYHSTNDGSVLINGQRAPFVGRICMDQCMVKLNGPVPVGTLVTLIGADGNDEITMDEIASRLNTINYEIPCVINSRVPRIYKGIK
ncbi:alanine racemase [bacterium LRH843]|nr:alanine racemase [bacterium LRH843]